MIWVIIGISVLFVVCIGNIIKLTIKNRKNEYEQKFYSMNEELLYYLLVQLYSAYGEEITINLIDNSIKMILNNNQITLDGTTREVAEQVLSCIFVEDGEDDGQS